MKSSDFIEKISLGYGIGLGVVSYVVFLLSLVGFRITRTLLLIIVMAGVLPLFIDILRKKGLRKIKELNYFRLISLFTKILFCQSFVFISILSLGYLRRLVYFSFVNVAVVVFLLVVFGILLVSLLGRKRIRKFIKRSSILMPLEVFFVVLIFDFFLASLILTLYWPVFIWDALTLFDSRAKIFLDQGTALLYHDQFTLRYLTAYPFMTSIYHFIVYLAGGVNPQFIYSFFYLFLLLGFYSFLKKECSIKIALLSSFLLGSTPIFFHHSTFAYTNLCFVYYFSLGLLYFYRGLKKDVKGELLIGVFLFGLSAWLRPGTEIFFLATLFGIVVYSIAKRNFKPVFWLLIFYLFFSLPWYYYTRIVLDINAYDSVRVGQALLGKLKIDIEGFRVIVQGFCDLQRNVNDFGWILYLLIGVLVLFPERVYKEIFFVFLVSLNILAWIILGYGLGIWRNFNYSWQAIFYDSMGRILMIFVPLYLYFIVKNLNDFLKNESS